MRDLIMCIAGLLVAACSQGPPVAAPPLSGLPTASLIVEWDDADSGRINGQRFRVADVDAPETGGVGAAVGAARCEHERELGLAAKAWAEGLTNGADVTIIKEHGFDDMREPRHLLDIAVNGKDYATLGIESGHLKRWDHNGTRPLQIKPDWCSK
jgi:endonuclease YncB( thermonuclease family)